MLFLKKIAETFPNPKNVDEMEMEDGEEYDPANPESTEEREHISSQVS